MFGIRKEILQAIDPDIKLGDSFRLVHEKKIDGAVCSLGKDAALSVTREKNGWVYYCHRCHEQGFIADDKKSPMEVKSMIEKLKGKKTHKLLAHVELPYDFIPLCKDFNTDDVTLEVCDWKAGGPIPWSAYHWLWQYNIKERELWQFNIGWSEGYHRVIIPIYDYGSYDGTTEKKLVGWVGREVECESKEERKAKKIAKYLTRKSKATKRVYWSTPAIKNRNNVVIVEDIVSAIKIHKSTGMETIALLNSHVGDDLLRKCQGKRVHIWLDGNMLAKSVGYTTRFRQFGLEASHVHTPKDPKTYNELFIASQFTKGE
jgi:hypothetical protein